MIVEEQVAGGYKNIAGAEGISICGLVNGAVVRWQADAEIPVVERVVGFRAELERETFRDLCILEQRHVPNVQAGCPYRVSAGIRLSADPGLNEPRSRIVSKVADSKC